MSIRNAVYSALSGISPAPDVYPDVAPQGSTFPRLTYQFVAGSDDVLLDGYGSTARRIVQVDAWATDPDVADSMIEDAKAALGASLDFSVGGVTENGGTGYDDEAKAYRASRDFSLLYSV